ncbi:hypothetical protein [Stieleria varia]|uniref:Leucine Rich repeats (2 copies) n=1 Tax=Stieleria varia TaxID=2528005 RepID=A0A5C6APE2_9BACT|nr:hypothetical protein [Stieleria varia]TWU00892.1 hypothetical protein Pla52n_42610 [Stieleria varia]
MNVDSQTTLRELRIPMKHASNIRRMLRFLACHRLACLAVILTTIPLVLIIVPGEFTYPWTDETGELNAWKLRSNDLRQRAHDNHKEEFGHRATTLTVFEHGWPRPFLARVVICNCNDRGVTRSRSQAKLRVKSWFLYWGGSRFIPVSWSNYDNWPFHSDDWIIDVWGTLIDLLVAAAIVVFVGGFTYWWFRNRSGRFWTFQLRDMLLLMTFVAVGLGVYAYHHHARIREGLAPATKAPGFSLHDGHMTAGQDYCGPEWIRKLAGNRYFPQPFHHVTRVYIRDNGQWSDCYHELLNFPYLETLHSGVEIPVTAMKSLQQCKSLKHLALNFNSSPKQSPILTMGVDQLKLLEQLQLESIQLYGEQIKPRHVEQLASIPSIRRILLHGADVNEEQAMQIRQRFPTLKIIIQTDWERLFSSG